MAKRRRKNKSSKCPDPINTMLDLAGALTLGLYTKHKIKKDFAKGEGEESAKAAGMVFGLGSMRSGSRGIINLGGLIGLNSALKEIEKQQNVQHPPFLNKILDARVEPTPPIKKYMWRNHCEDGSIYGINPRDYETADEYNDALENAKQEKDEYCISLPTADNAANERRNKTSSKHVWRKYCEDGQAYGVDPNDYETADDYELALLAAKEEKRTI